MAGSQNVGRLNVKLLLDKAAFSAGLSQASGMVGKFGTSIKSMMTSATSGLQGKLVAAMAPASLAALGVSAANTAAEIERMSSISNASAGQFQEWAAGAKSVGIEQDQLADILKDMNDRVGDFISTGGGPMKDFFDVIGPKVGVTAQQFRNLSGPDALQLYVSSLEKANVNQQDFTFYMEAIASESTALLPLLKNGGKAMQEYGQRARDMGAIMSDETIVSLRAGKAALADMSLAGQGLRNTIGAALVPALQTMSDIMVSAATFINQNGATIAEVMRTVAGAAVVTAGVFATRYAVSVGVTAVRAMMSAVTQSIALEMALGAQSRSAAVASLGIKGLTGALTLLRGAILATGFGALIVGAGYLLGKFSELVTATGGFGNALSLLGDVASGVWQGITESAAAIPLGLSARWEAVKADFFSMVASLAEKWGEFVQWLSDKTPKAVKAAKDYLFGESEDDAGSSAASWRDAADAADAASKAYADAASNVASGGMATAKDALAKLSDAMNTASASASDTTLTFNNLGDGLGQVSTGSDKAKEKLTDLQKVMKRLKDTNEELIATANMTDVDADVWRNQREAGVSAGSADGKRIADLTKMNAGMQSLKDSTKEWQSSISSAFGSFLSGTTKFKDALGQVIGKLGEMAMNSAFQGLFSGSSGWMGNILSSLGIGANANGTNNWRGGLTRINERGGEIVDLPSGTRIIPHDVSNRLADNAGRPAYEPSLSASSLVLTDDGKIMAQVDARIVQSGRASSQATLAHMRKTKAGWSK